MGLDIDKFYTSKGEQNDVRIDDIEDKDFLAALNKERLLQSYSTQDTLGDQDYGTLSASMGYSSNEEADFAAIQANIQARKESEEMARNRYEESGRAKSWAAMTSNTKDIPVVGTAVRLLEKFDKMATLMASSSASMVASGAIGLTEQVAASGSVGTGAPGIIRKDGKTAPEGAKELVAPLRAMADDIPENLGIDPDLAATALGQTLQVASSLGTGFVGIATNPALGFSMFEGLAFDEAVREYDAHAKNPNAADRLKFGLSVALPQSALDFAIGGEATFARIIAGANPTVRKELLKRLAFGIPKEGFTEGAQKEIMTFMANREFDQDREHFDDEFFHSVLLGMAGAGVIGPIVSLPTIANANTNQVLDNENFGKQAFNTIAKTLTKEEFVANAGDNPAAKTILEAAYDGDEGAQKAVMDIFEQGKAEAETKTPPKADKEVKRLVESIEKIDDEIAAATSEIEPNLDVVEDQFDMPLATSNPRDPNVDITQANQANRKVAKVHADLQAELREVLDQLEISTEPNAKFEKEAELTDAQERTVSKILNHISGQGKKLTPKQFAVLKERVRGDKRVEAAIAKGAQKVERAVAKKERELFAKEEKIANLKEAKVEAINNLKHNFGKKIDKLRDNFAKRVEKLKEEAKRRKVADKEKFVEERLDLIEASRQLQEMVDSLPVSIRGKFKGFANLSKVKTLKGKESFLERAAERVNKLFDAEFRRNKRSKLNDTIRRNTKGSFEKRTKRIGNEAADIFTEIKAIGKRDSLDNLQRLEELLEEPNMSEEKALALKTIFSVFNNIKGADAKRLNQALAIAAQIEQSGLDFRKKFKKKEAKRLEGKRQVVIDATVGDKGILTEKELKAKEEKKGFVKKAISNANDWAFNRNDALEQLLENIRTDKGERFEGDLHDAFTKMAFDATQEFHTRQGKDFQELGDAMFEIFERDGKTKKQAQKAMGDFETTNDNHGIKFAPEGGQVIDVPLTRWEAVQLWMWRQDPTLQPSFETMKWGEDTDAKVEDYIGDAGIAAGEKMLETYKRIGLEVNEVLFGIEGRKLALVDNYSPAFKHAKGKEIDLDEALDMDTLIPAWEGNNSLKERTKNKNALRINGAHRAFEKHVSDMNHYMAFARIAKDMRNTFKDADVRKAIRQVTGGTSVLNLLDGQIDDIIRGSLDRVKVDTMMNQIIGNLAVSKIALNLSSALKQLGSVPAYADGMPAGVWLAEFSKFFLDVPGNSKVLLESEYMKNRLRTSHDRDLRAVVSSKSFANEIAGVRNIRDKLMVLTRMGDAGAILAGGYPVYAHTKAEALKAGMSPEAAHAEGLRKFSRATDRAQQSAEIMSRGYWQRGGSTHKLFTMYMTSPIQYNRIMIGAIKAAAKGRISKKQALKSVFIYHVLLPQVFTAMASMGIGAFSEAEDDDKLNKFWKRQRSALAIGNFNSVFLVGDAYEAIVKVFSQNASVFEQEVSLPIMDQFQDFVKAAQHIDDGEVLESADDLMSALMSFGGLPYDPVRENIEGAWEAATGETDNPVMRMMGFSDWALLEEKETKGTSTRKRRRNYK